MKIVVMDKDTTDVKVCRYCKQKPDISEKVWEDGTKMHMVICPRCHARTYSSLDLESAMYKWNQIYGIDHGGEK